MKLLVSCRLTRLEILKKKAMVRTTMYMGEQKRTKKQSKTYKIKSRSKTVLY